MPSQETQIFTWPRARHPQDKTKKICWESGANWLLNNNRMNIVIQPGGVPNKWFFYSADHSIISAFCFINVWYYAGFVDGAGVA